ncbi:hypothetical protein Tco_1407194 [Tanacetum coccineum]
MSVVKHSYDAGKLGWRQFRRRRGCLAPTDSRAGSRSVRTGAVASGSYPPQSTILTWLNALISRNPRFRSRIGSRPLLMLGLDSHHGKIFDVMDCNDAFKTRLAVYSSRATRVGWCFPIEAEQERLNEGVVFTDVAQVADAARNLEILRDRDDYDRSEPILQALKSGVRYHVGHLSRIVTGGHEQKKVVKGLTGRAVGGKLPYYGDGRDQYEQRAAIPRSTNSGPISPGVPYEGLYSPSLVIFSVDCKKTNGASSVGHADKKARRHQAGLCITQDQAANQYIWYHHGFLATIHDTTSDVSSIHDSAELFLNFRTLFLEELPGIPPIAMLSLTFELFPGA